MTTILIIVMLMFAVAYTVGELAILKRGGDVYNWTKVLAKWLSKFKSK